MQTRTRCPRLRLGSRREIGNCLGATAPEILKVQGIHSAGKKRNAQQRSVKCLSTPARLVQESRGLKETLTADSTALRSWKRFAASSCHRLSCCPITVQLSFLCRVGVSVHQVRGVTCTAICTSMASTAKSGAGKALRQTRSSTKSCQLPIVKDWPSDGLCSAVYPAVSIEPGRSR